MTMTMTMIIVRIIMSVQWVYDKDELIYNLSKDEDDNRFTLDSKQVLWNGWVECGFVCDYCNCGGECHD